MTGRVDALITIATIVGPAVAVSWVICWVHDRRAWVRSQALDRAHRDALARGTIRVLGAARLAPPSPQPPEPRPDDPTCSPANRHLINRHLVTFDLAAPVVAVTCTCGWSVLVGSLLTCRDVANRHLTAMRDQQIAELEALL